MKWFPLVFVFVACLLPLNISADLFWADYKTGDAALSVDRFNRPESPGESCVVVGYDSGDVVCYSSTPTSPPITLWSAHLDESVTALMVFPDIRIDGYPLVFAGTDKGQVAGLIGGGKSAGDVYRQFSSICGIAAFACIPDVTGDGIGELAAGGAEQAVYLYDVHDDSIIWKRDLDPSNGSLYIHLLTHAGDLNTDGVPDIMARTWSGHLWALKGEDGSDVWKLYVDGGFTDAMVRFGDVNGDGLPDFLVGGTTDIVSMRSGSDGSSIWYSYFDRPIRDVAPILDIDDDGTTDALACTAGGDVACISGKGSGSVSPIWTANIGDVCRDVESISDLDGDSGHDAVVCGENGVVAAFNGSDGTPIWSWQASDVVRHICVVSDTDGDGFDDVVALLLDGTVALISGNSMGTFGVEQDLSFQQSTIQRNVHTPSVRPGEHPTPSSGDFASKAGADEVPIILWHDIIPDVHYTYGCSVENFTAQMDLLVEGGYTCVSLDQIADWIEGKDDLPTRPICLTFDGPYEGHHTHAYQIMKERGLFAISYITADWIGTANHCDWHHLREMDEDAVEDIQNHTINHPNLTTVSEAEVRKQLSECNESIRRHLNGKIATHHAYPGCAYNSSVMQICSEEGIRTATTCAGRRAVKSDNLFALPRFTITKGTTLDQFKTWIQYDEPIIADPLPYEYVGEVGSSWGMPSFGDVDAEGKLWVCDYTKDDVRVFHADGTEASFSPITQGKNQAGETVTIDAPSGVAVTPSGKVLVSICDYFDTPQYLGVLVYDASTGAAEPGFDVSYKLGDIDCDSDGNIFIVDKVDFNWHVYTPDFVEMAGSPFGPGTTNHIQRGIAVRPDSSMVYVISETDGVVHVWSGTVSDSTASYTKQTALYTALTGPSGGVDVMNDKTVLVGDDNRNIILGFRADHSVWGILTDVPRPRGCAFTPDGSYLWTISQSSSVKKWKRKATQMWLAY